MASGNPYFTGVNQTLEEYIPMPMDMLLKAGQAVQGRYDQSIADDSAMETGLASIQAKAPAYKEYVNNMLNSYKGEMSSLIDKYGGKLENPEFIRDQKKVINRFKNDPNWTTITEGNKAIERTQEIEAKLKAEGKLFISPLAQFQGKDTQGNLTAFSGSPEAVNTLEDWESAYKIAHASTQDIGNKTTNRVSLNNARQAMLNDIKAGGVQSSKLIQAYVQQGMTPEQAKASVLSNVNNLVNKYGVDEKFNTGLMSLQHQIYDSNRNFNYRKDRDEKEDQLKRDIAAMKAAGKSAQPVLTPSFDGFATRMGSVASVVTKDEDNKIVSTKHVFGSGKSANGIQSRSIANETVSGKIYDLSSGSYRPVNQSIDIKDGVEIGTKNVWVKEENGELIMMDTNATPKLTYINGKAHITSKGKQIPVVERTVKEYSYDVNAGKKGVDAPDPELKTFFRLANPEEAIDQMGYSNASYEGMGQTKARGLYDTSKNRLDVDINFVQQNFGTEANKYFQSIEKKHNSGQKLTTQEIESLNMLKNYDTRKALWDAKILPKYQNQGKLKNIATTDED